ARDELANATLGKPEMRDGLNATVDEGREIVERSQGGLPVEARSAMPLVVRDRWRFEPHTREVASRLRLDPHIAHDGKTGGCRALADEFARREPQVACAEFGADFVPEALTR